MKIILLSILITIGISSFSQVQTKKLKVKNETEGYIETFNVIKPENTIKQGVYKKYYADKPAIIGEYNNDKKSGIWKFYDYDGVINLEYDYTNNKVISYPITEDKQIIISNSDTIRETIDRPILFLGSKKDLVKFIGINVNYPQYALNNLLVGFISVGLVINIDGSVENYYIVNGGHKVLNEEALRVAKLFKGEWLPAIKDGSPIKSVYIIPIKFILTY